LQSTPRHSTDYLISRAKKWEGSRESYRYLNIFSLEWQDDQPPEIDRPVARSVERFKPWYEVAGESATDPFISYLDWGARKSTIVDVSRGYTRPMIVRSSRDIPPDSTPGADYDPDLNAGYSSPLYLTMRRVRADGEEFIFCIRKNVMFRRVETAPQQVDAHTLQEVWWCRLENDSSVEVEVMSGDVQRVGAEDAVPKNFSWSTKGADVEFTDDEQIPLRHITILGLGGSAVVDKVICNGRILARKQIFCNRRLPLDTAIKELEVIRKVEDHRHVIEIVGSYTQRNVFGIFLHPAAECDLQTALERLDDHASGTFAHRTYYTRMRGQCLQYYGCLAHALAFLHDKKVRHRDIKPRNILVTFKGPLFTDFGEQTVSSVIISYGDANENLGIAKDFSESAHSTTSGPSSLTPVYCAPEVASWSERGRSSDIFSLGCVFMEMFLVLTTVSTFESCREFHTTAGDSSYHRNLERVNHRLDKLIEKSFEDSHGQSNGKNQLLFTIKQMLSLDRQKRPSALEIWNFARSASIYNPFGNYESKNLCGGCCFG
jgi:Protein kinase domain